MSFNTKIKEHQNEGALQSKDKQRERFFFIFKRLFKCKSVWPPRGRA